jgi:Ca2+-transporting ATPase
VGLGRFSGSRKKYLWDYDFNKLWYHRYFLCLVPERKLMSRFNGFVNDYSGLSSQEVIKLQQEHGRNELVPEQKDTFFRKVLEIIEEPMFLLLFGTAMLYFILGEPKDGSIMICFVAFMVGINVFQEWRTDRTLQALKDLSSPKVRVIRNGVIEKLDSKELTAGDLMLLEEGEKISADGQIIEMFDLGIDESTLTGESDVVWKKINLSPEDEEAHWRRNYCYAGTAVTQGSAIVKVMAIGLKTEYGKIGLDILSAPQQPTPLEKQTRYLIKVCSMIGLLLFIMVALATYVHTESIIGSILSGITLAMAMIPEEFPVILTVFLAMGAWRLAQKKSLIRRMPSVETLGSVSVLCVDKTGTLTKNKMTLQELSPFKGVAAADLLYWAALGCETEPYDPMEQAILARAVSDGINKQELFSNKLLLEYSFDSATKMMGHVWEINGAPSLAAKGSPESILPLCGLSTEDNARLEAEQIALASKGYRVIAVAKRTDMPSIPDKLSNNELELLGLLGLEDPPREAVPGAVKLCTQAGIRVVMITGDNGITAKSIAGKIGIPHSDEVITGKEIDGMSDEELKEKIKTANIFARVIPKHKMRIVRAFKEIGEIVAMTGDGVNDAPALKYADIGIAMGKRGTGVAREAADMILLDDNFTTIVETVKDGRRIYDNIKKAVCYVFVIHIPIALIALMTPIIHLPLLLLPIHVVLLELIIDPTCSIIFERQPAEEDIMDRPPRSSRESLVNTSMMIKALLQGLSIFAVALGSYSFLYENGAPVELARTFAIVVLGFSNLFLVYVNQSNKQFALAMLLKWRDKVIILVNAAIFAALALIVYLPAGNSVAKTMPLSFNEVAAAIGLAALATLWWELVKVFQRFFPASTKLRK